MGVDPKMVKDKIEEKEKDIRQLEFEKNLVAQGILVPAEDLFKYMVRNYMYMTLIESDEFKSTGIDLDKLISDEDIKNFEKEANATLAGLDYITSKLVTFKTPKEEVSQNDTV